MLKRFFHQSGQTLIEVLVALGIAGIVVAAIVTLVTVALKNTQFTKEQHVATEFAQQAMEQIRTIRDTQWSTFASYIPSQGTRRFCLDQDSVSLRSPPTTTCGLNMGTYVRIVEFENNVAPCIGIAAKVTTYVLWRDAKCQQSSSDEFVLYCHQVKLSSCFSNTSVLPTP